MDAEKRREFEGLRVPRVDPGVQGGGVHLVGVVVPDKVGHVAQIIPKQCRKYADLGGRQWPRRSGAASEAVPDKVRHVPQIIQKYAGLGAASAASERPRQPRSGLGGLGGRT